MGAVRSGYVVERNLAHSEIKPSELFSRIPNRHHKFSNLGLMLELLDPGELLMLQSDVAVSTACVVAQPNHIVQFSG